MKFSHRLFIVAICSENNGDNSPSDEPFPRSSPDAPPVGFRHGQGARSVAVGPHPESCSGSAVSASAAVTRRTAMRRSRMARLPEWPELWICVFFILSARDFRGFDSIVICDKSR